MRDSCPEKIGERAAGGGQGKIRRSYSLNPMKIRVNTTNLNSEQVKFLSQLGQFRGEPTWEAHCDPDEFHEAVDLLKRSGIEDVFVQFGN